MSNLKMTRDGAVATVTIDRAEKLNALDATTLDELEAAFRDLRHDSAVGAVILTGAGDKAFVAGADIGELARQTPTSGKQTALRGQRLFRDLELFPKPLLGAVNGFALGGGCELALCCHVRVASENASFGLPEVGLGIIPGYGGTQRLARLVGRGRALEMVLSGTRIPAAEAHRIGLVNRVVPLATLLAETRNLADTMLRNGPLALAAAIEVVQHGLETSLDEGMRLEANAFGVLCGTDDMREGLQAFLEKRKAVFKGR